MPEHPGMRAGRLDVHVFDVPRSHQTQEDSDETLAAEGEYLTALGVGRSMVQ
jgi:hypothetical protein